MTPGAEQLVAVVRRWGAETEALVVAIDGYGASGKTTLAAEAALVLGAVTLHTDDYFHEAAGSDPRPMAQYYDWNALRRAIPLSDAPLILVEGVSAAAPALADLVTHTVFVATPERVRLERLHERITAEEWDEDWLAAERMYFASRPPESFDLVISGSTEDPAGHKITG